jgi:hypothetical protein
VDGRDKPGHDVIGGAMLAPTQPHLLNRTAAGQARA